MSEVDLMRILQHNLNLMVDLRDNANHLKYETLHLIADKVCNDFATAIHEMEKGLV